MFSNTLTLSLALLFTATQVSAQCATYGGNGNVGGAGGAYNGQITHDGEEICSYKGDGWNDASMNCNEGTTATISWRQNNGPLEIFVETSDVLALG